MAKAKSATSSKLDWNDIFNRLAKTFVQSFAAVLLATNQPISKSALVAALAAGISAVWNTVKQVIATN